MICSNCGSRITSCALPEPHPPSVGPPARLCVPCRRAAVDRAARTELAARYRLEMAAPKLLEACLLLIAWGQQDEGEHRITLPGCMDSARAAVALAVLPEAREEGTDARD